MLEPNDFINLNDIELNQLGRRRRIISKKANLSSDSSSTNLHTSSHNSISSELQRMKTHFKTIDTSNLILFLAYLDLAFYFVVYLQKNFTTLPTLYLVASLLMRVPVMISLVARRFFSAHEQSIDIFLCYWVSLVQTFALTILLPEPNTLKIKSTSLKIVTYYASSVFCMIAHSCCCRHITLWHVRLGVIFLH